jgi:hypothetical protein
MQEKQNECWLGKWIKPCMIAMLLAAPASAAFADDLPVPRSMDAAGTDPITDYFLHWFDRADLAQATQPHWMTPITTVTPRLEQEFRYDQFQQFLQNGAQIDNYFGGKGWNSSPLKPMRSLSTWRLSSSGSRRIPSSKSKAENFNL